MWELEQYCKAKNLNLTYAWTEDRGRKGGRIHYHVLTSLRFIPRNFLKQYWQNGYVDIRSIHNEQGALDYLDTYIDHWNSPNIGYSDDVI